jgi:hypothetical protein
MCVTQNNVMAWGNTDEGKIMTTDIQAPIKKIRKWVKEVRGGRTGSTFVLVSPEEAAEIADALAAQAEHIAELERDAGRYQFIRSGGIYIEPQDDTLPYVGWARGKYCKTEAEFDEQVDSAIAAQSKEGE